MFQIGIQNPRKHKQFLTTYFNMFQPMIGNGDVYDGQNQIIDGTTASDTGVANQISASLTIGNVSNCFTIFSTNEHRALVHSRDTGPLALRRLNLLLRATLESVVHSQCFSHSTNEKKEVNKSFSVQWPLNS